MVLICRRPTCNKNAATAWDNAAAYVNIYPRHIVCPRHWSPACLRSWAEFNFAGKPAIVGDENNLCEHYLRRSATLCITNSSIFPTIPDTQNGRGECHLQGCPNLADKVWYWTCDFFRPWSIGCIQYILWVLIFSNSFFLLIYLIIRTRVSKNWHLNRTIRSILLMKLLKIAPIWFAFHANLSTTAIQRRCASDPLNRWLNIVCCKRQLNRR